jgi:hypothetical protein
MKAHDRDREPPALSPSAEALLAHERVPPSQPELVLAQALARARQALREGVPTASAPRVGPSLGRRILFAAAAGVVLIGGVAAAFQLIKRPAPAPAPPVNTAAPPAEQALPTIPPPVASAAAPTAAPVPSRRATISRGQGDGLEELRLLSRARQSDARGDYAQVLAIVAEHERRHPAGRLAEEREVLRVKALVGLGRLEEARAAAAKFRRSFPRSVLLPKVDQLLASSM